MNGNGHLSDVKVPQAASFEPTENFFVGMLRLVIRRVPVEGIEHAPLWIGVERHGNHHAENATSGTPDERDPPQEIMDVVEGHRKRA